MTTTNVNRPARDRTSPLRLVLVANAATSALAGLVAATAPGAVVELLGFEHTDGEAIVRIIGLGLLAFAAAVAATAARHRTATFARNVGLISAADAAWVISTVIVVAAVDLSGTGRAVAIVMAIGVAVFAGLQLHHRRPGAAQP